MSVLLALCLATVVATVVYSKKGKNQPFQKRAEKILESREMQSMNLYSNVGPQVSILRSDDKQYTS